MLTVHLNGLQVAWPHVLASVHTEALHANVDEVVEVVSDLAAHVVLGPVQVVQAHQVAVSHLMERKGIYSTVRRVIEAVTLVVKPSTC